MVIRRTAPFLVTIVILAHSAPGDARAGAAYDFAIRLTGQIQVNYVETIISIYRRSMPTYENLLARYGQYSWADTFRQRYNDMVDEVQLLQGLLDSRGEELPTVVGEEIVWSAEFDLVQQGRERLVETRHSEVEERSDRTVRLFRETVELYERADTVRRYRGRVIYTLYSNGERVPNVAPLLLSTEQRIETREEVSRLLLREYEIPELILPESPIGVPTEHVLSVEDYHARDDVLLRYSDTYANAVWARNPNVNPDYITRDSGLGFYANSLDYIGAPQAWARGWTGRGSVLAILDTGIDLDHSEFAGRILATGCFASTCDAGLETVQDGNRFSHGTHVAGIAAAAFDGEGTTGVAPDASLLIGRVAYDSGFYQLGRLGEAISWAVENGADAINVSGNYNVDRVYRDSVESIGDGVFYAFDDRAEYATRGYTHMLDSDWILPGLSEAMAGNEAVVVISAGNNRMPTATFPAHYAIQENEDGELLLDGRVLIAGSWDVRGNRISSFSNAAGTMCFEVANDGSCVNDRRISDWYILAPGQWIAAPSNNGQYTVNSGTSMAAPMITGAVGIIHQMWPHMTGRNIVQLLLETADDSIDGYDVNVHGQGLLDLDMATQPQGGLGIPLTGRIDGATGDIAALGGMRIAGATIGALESMMVVDEFDREFFMDGNRMNYGGSSFSSFDEATDLGIPFGNFSINLGEGGYGISVGFEGLRLGLLAEAETFIGNYAQNALIDVEGAQSAFVSYGVDFAVGDTDFFMMGEVGISDLNVNSHAMMVSAGTIISTGASLGFTHEAGRSSYSLAASLPLAIVSGDALFRVPSSVSESGQISYATMPSSLSNQSREVSLGFAFERDLSTEATLSATAQYRRNAGHFGGSDVAQFGMMLNMRF